MVGSLRPVRENDGISREFCTHQKRGGIPPSQKCKKAWKRALHYGFDPLKSCGFLLKRSGFMLKIAEIMLKNAETHHKATIT